MSYAIIYRIWAEREGDVIKIWTVSQDNNVFPKPSDYEKQRGFAREWESFRSFDLDSMRDFTLRYAKGISGGSIREATRLTGKQSWKRWRNRFLRAGGPDIGEVPGAITWDDAPRFIADPWPEILKFPAGLCLTPSDADFLISNGTRTQIDFVRKGTPYNRKEHSRSGGALGFKSGETLCYYRSNSRRKGFEMEFERFDYFVRVGVEVQLKPEADTLIVPTVAEYTTLNQHSFLLHATGAGYLGAWNAPAIASQIDYKLIRDAEIQRMRETQEWQWHFCEFDQNQATRAATTLNKNTCLKKWRVVSAKEFLNPNNPTTSAK